MTVPEMGTCSACRHLYPTERRVTFTVDKSGEGLGEFRTCPDCGEKLDKSLMQSLMR